MTEDSIAVKPFVINKNTQKSIHCASDKSLTHRSIMFSSLAKGKSIIQKPLLGADCLSTVDCFKKMGVDIKIENDEIQISSPGIEKLKSPTDDLDCGNSGTTARLMLGLLAGIDGISARLIGDESLQSRPMGRVTDHLEMVGAKYRFEGSNKTLPVTVEGGELRAADFCVAQSSAQVKSAILLSNINKTNKISISLPDGSRDHTENFLKIFDAKIAINKKNGKEMIEYQGPTKVLPHTYKVPVDPSSAAFFCALTLLMAQGDSTICDIDDNPTRLGFFKVMSRMSDFISKTSGEERGFVEKVTDIKVKSGQIIKPTTIEAHEVPTLVDEIPILAVLAAFAKKESVFKGLSELRVKESDRLSKTFELLEKAGCSCKIIGDDLHIEGGLTRAKAFSYDSEGDHRLAMSAAILASFADGECIIHNSSCVDVSFPGFYQLLNSFEGN